MRARPTATDLPKAKRPIATRMLAICRPYAAYMILALAIVLLMILCANFLPVLVMRALDEYIVGKDFTGTPDARLTGLARIAILYVLVASVAFVLRFSQTYLLSWIGQRAVRDIRRQVFAKVLNLPFAYFDRTPAGRILTRVTSDVAAMQRALTDDLVGLVADCFAVVGIMGFMLYLNARLALFIFCVLPVLAVIVVFINNRSRRAHRAIRSEQADLNAGLQELIGGMLTIQLFNRERVSCERFGRMNEQLHTAFSKSILWLSLFFPSIEILGGCTTALLLGVGGYAMLQGSDVVTAGVLVAFLIYVRDFFRPLEDLSERFNNLQSALASGERIFGLLDEPEELANEQSPARLTRFEGRVAFEDVSFAYQDEDWVLEDVNLHIEPGQSVAFVGATGAGKTTIASLVARFYDVRKGCVRVDGHDVRDLRLTDLRQRIAIVLQDPFIFAGTVWDNIGLCHPKVSKESILEAARFVNADAFIRALPAGYDTVLNERGAGLSVGQKQLLALARALAQNPDILLILDEATANVDTETERLIQDALRKLMKGRTSMIIAHRLSTIQHVDRIYVLRRGRIVEEGRHRDLIRQGGYYKRLYDLLFYPRAGQEER